MMMTMMIMMMMMTMRSTRIVENDAPRSRCPNRCVASVFLSFRVLPLHQEPGKTRVLPWSKPG